MRYSMTNLKIKRINTNKFQVKDGDKVVRECSSFKEANNAILSEDLILLDNLADFCEPEYMDELDIMELVQAC